MVGKPTVLTLSLMMTGSPASGPSSAPPTAAVIPLPMISPRRSAGAAVASQARPAAQTEAAQPAVQTEAAHLRTPP